MLTYRIILPLLFLAVKWASNKDNSMNYYWNSFDSRHKTTDKKNMVPFEKVKVILMFLQNENEFSRLLLLHFIFKKLLNRIELFPARSL